MMNELKCPKCGEVFKVDESGYAQIVSQVRNKEFLADIKRRENEIEERMQKQMEVSLLVSEKQQNEAMAEKEAELNKLNNEVLRLSARINEYENEKKLAVNEAVNAKEKELVRKDAEITRLEGELEKKEFENQLEIKTLKENHEIILKGKEEQIQYYKDFKMRQSTKMVGESLEQHCRREFDLIRTTAFPNAYFEKDNDAKTGSKGDFIFRDSVDGIEYISIMFEMKNEADETKTKHKNEDFFKELDKDRNEKSCEYAVLVSTLEADNDYYNNGIVDVSYKYPKMYVIRPQFFITMISLLRNAARNSLEYRRELREMKSQQLDLENFENNMNQFKKGFERNFRLASDKFQEAIDEIDKTIDHLKKVKNALVGSENNLRLANEKAQDLSIKKLTKNAPSLGEKFAAVSAVKENKIEEA